MSRIGKQPVALPDKVTVTIKDGTVAVKGPKGEATQVIPEGITVAVDEAGKEAVVTRAANTKQVRALHGLMRSLLNNMVIGVTEGYERRLRVMGAGYRVESKGRDLQLNVGYGHPVVYSPPTGVEIEVPKSTSREYMDFIVKGIDKQAVGEVASQLRRIRPPDLYKGKGIRYGDENVRRLEGKSFGA